MQTFTIFRKLRRVARSLFRSAPTSIAVRARTTVPWVPRRKSRHHRLAWFCARRITVSAWAINKPLRTVEIRHRVSAAQWRLCKKKINATRKSRWPWAWSSRTAIVSLSPRISYVSCTYCPSIDRIALSVGRSFGSLGELWVVCRLIYRTCSSFFRRWNRLFRLPPF